MESHFVEYFLLRVGGAIIFSDPSRSTPLVSLECLSLTIKAALLLLMFMNSVFDCGVCHNCHWLSGRSHATNSYLC